MKSSTFTISLLSAVVIAGTAGCGAVNYCDISTLYPGMTAEQKANCDQCGSHLPCSDDGTGGEIPTDVTELGSYVIAYVGDVTSQLGSEAQAFTVHPASECEARVGPVPCARTWFDPHSNSLECTTCNLPETNLVRAPEPADAWAICGPGQVGDLWHAAKYSDANLQVSGWAGDLDCYQWPIEGQRFVCPDGQMALADGSGTMYPNTFTWTCRCPSGSDTACQPGAVCEAGYVLDGVIPKPTLCTWDDGQGTANGIAPEGPIVYGLTRWEDGITEVRDNVTIKAQMYMGLIQGLLNDDQRIDYSTGTLTHCGPDALCSHLGLREGDTIDFDIDVESLEDGDAISVIVTRADGSTRVLTVAIAD
jgi:hypothetical protein